MRFRRRRRQVKRSDCDDEEENDESSERFRVNIKHRNLLVVNDRKLARKTQKIGDSGYHVRVMFLLLFISILLLALLVRGQQQQQQLYYYVSLPKVGFIRGLRIEGHRMPAAGANQVVPVAAFLGIPYAAPPTGLLRFMPPGATSIVNQRPIEQGHLMMMEAAALVMGQSQAQLPPRVGIRPHIHFGPHCVHLPDWLEPDPPLANGTEIGSNKNGLQSATLPAMNRNRQSEDCLNLNVFIPINEKPLAMQQRHTKLNQNPSQFQAAASSSSHSQQASAQHDHHFNVSPPSAINNTTGNYHQSNTNNFSSPNQAPVQVWPLPKLLGGGQEEASGLPVLVVVHGMSGGARGRQNSFDYLHLARRTNSLVITFNYRLGLLGFLPYSINERSSSSSSSSSRWLSRNNHAIWDQIGLLHWLNRNAIHFDGDPRNITLVAADNEANQFVQLLTMSPLAKGLFNRIVLAHDEIWQNNYYKNNFITTMPTAWPGGYPSALAKLLARASGARDSRRRLISGLMRVVQQMAPEMMKAGTVADDERKALEFVQSINLTRLAKIDQKLRQLTGFSTGSGSGGSHQGALDEALGPALDDRLLFPQLSALASFQATIGRDVEFLNSKLNYCHYLRQLRAGRPDPLNLLARSALPRGGGSRAIGNASSSSSSPTGNWHRDANVPQQQRQRHTNGSTNSFNRIVVANFDHLHNLHLLARLMGFETQHDSLGVYTGEEGEGEVDGDVDGDEDDDDEEDDVDDFSEVSRRQQDRRVLAAHGAAMLRRQSDDTDLFEEQAETVAVPGKRSAPSDPSQDLGQLMELLASVDLMVGYFKQFNGSMPLSFGPVGDSGGGSSFLNITNALFRTQLEDSVDQKQQQQYPQNNLLWLLEMADLHYISILAPADTTAQYCDLFLATTLTPIKSGHLFMVLEQYALDGDKGRQDSNWLIDTANDSSSSTMLLDGLGNFVRFGDPNTKAGGSKPHINASSGHYWPAYDPLDRKLKLIASNETMQTHHYGYNNLSYQNAFNRFMRDQIGAHLDLVPYLNALELYGRNNNSSTTKTTATTIGENTLSSDRFELYNCLRDIDNFIGTFPMKYIGRKQHDHKINAPQKFHCLSDSISRFRTLLRQYGADDLEPINKLRHTTTRQITTNSTRSNIAMRNLVSDSSANNDLQQLDQPEIQAIQNGLLEVPKQTQGQELAKLAGLLGGGGVGSNSNNSQRKSNGIGGFFQRLYKDAAGQALALVVGCGLIIFLVNLAIVVIITLRASRIRRRDGESGGNSETTGGPKGTGRFAGGIQADELESKQMQANGNTLPSACKRSSMKTTYNGDSATMGHMNLRLGDTHNCQSMQRGVKQLKFDLSGTKLAGPGGRNDLSEDDGHEDSSEEIERRGGRTVVLGSPEMHCPNKTFQQMEPMMFLSTSPDPCNESLLLASSGAQNDTGKLHLLEDCNGNRLMATAENNDDDDNEQHQMGLLTELQELRAQDLAHGGWQVDESRYIKQTNHYNHNHNHHLNHQHVHHHQQHNHHNHHHHSGSLNSPAFGSQSTTTTNSTTNGINNSQCHGLGEGSRHHQSRQHQQLIDTTSPSDHRRFLTQNSPDSSATISVTPIQLESFAGAIPLSPIGLQAEGEFNLIEPVGLFYPTGFTSADTIQQANSNKIFMLDHQQQPQQQVSFCSRHQRL